MCRQPAPTPISPLTVDIESVYQPIVVLGDRTLVGYEALTRTRVGSPRSTFPELLLAAEHLDAAVAFDWRCRLTAVQGALAAGFPDGLTLFVNAEPAALDAPPPPGSLPLLAAAEHLSVTVELTERKLMSDPAGLLRAVEHARHLGWHIAVDDVGADSSSLALLPLLRPDVIKLDMTLVQGRATSETAVIVAAVAAEADRTGALVLAEGIENERHEHTARDMGANLGQGFLYGAPEPLPAVVGHHEAGSHSRRGPAMTVRAPAAVTPYGLTHQLGAPRRAGEALFAEMEGNLLRSAAATGPSTLVLVTVPASPGPTPRREEALNSLATHTALTAVFHSGPASPGRRYRAVEIGPDEPLAQERSIVIVAPMLTVALIALDRGPAADGTHRYDYSLAYDRKVVLDAATVLLQRIPSDHQWHG